MEALARLSMLAISSTSKTVLSLVLREIILRNALSIFSSQLTALKVPATFQASLRVFTPRQFFYFFTSGKDPCVQVLGLS